MTHSTYSRTKLIYALVAVAALIVLLMWMQGSFEDKVEPGVSEAVADGEVDKNAPTAKVVRKDIEKAFAWPGTVAARTVAQIAPKIPGRILEIPVRAGERVKQGQVLARLDARETQARLGQARAALAAAEAQAGQARADARRLQNLYDKEAATRQDLDAVLATAQTAEARVREARDAIREAESSQAETVLRAPFDGVIVERRLEPGDMALPGTAILVLQESQRLRIESAVPAQCAGLVKIGDELKVRIANPESEFKAVVDEIQPAADPKTRTVLVKARLPEDSGVQPGAFGWLYQSCGQDDVLLVPVSAVNRVGQLESVRLLVENHARLRHVRTGKRHDGQIEILSGLKEGDTVLLSENGR
ncbi:efflux RND transporter periplasmic adaptor subunit [Methylocaldum sp.]|uniref:efflux RND transporter periplasmic adaptor subunit n=1 Tax=Methylocaldum sp. TaxID=1969727 RepID=UPI002D2B98EF|nr:efflux RND transporter periplasmic adaptor subunit [Methylocaldum sp.]HYE37014.1 efflux RND transporter periplasmic adaptor subunit [Methylocaldum sp.]